LEAGLAGVFVACVAYEAILLCLGAFVGFYLAHAVEKLAVEHMGVDAATFEDGTIAFIWYSVFVLGCWGLVASKKHTKYLGVVTSFFGGALVASSVLYFQHGRGKWVDCFERLLHGAESEAALQANLSHDQTATAYAVWAIAFLIGTCIQCKKARAREVGVASLDGVVTIDRN